MTADTTQLASRFQRIFYLGEGMSRTAADTANDMIANLDSAMATVTEQID